MKKKLTIILIFLSIAILLTFTFYYLKGNSASKTNTVILGKIVNAKKKYFVVSQDPFNFKSDTIYVIKNNKYKGKINADHEGLYFVFIYPEFQTFYFKPGDSLAFVLNTNEFDESLSFSGTSGIENNILINLFLLNEKESLALHKQIPKISPEKILKLTDSFFKIKTDYIKSYNPEYKKTTTHFKKILSDYKTFARCRILEFYARKHKGNLPDNFFDYRKTLNKTVADANIPDIIYFTQYYIENNIPVNISNIKKHKQVIKIVDRDIADPNVQDNILFLYCKNYINDNMIYSAKDSVYTLYMQSFKKPIYKEHCQQMILINEKLSPGKIIPNVDLVNIMNKEVKLRRILKPKKKYILAFSDIYHQKNLQANKNKFIKFKEQYPDLEILIINKNLNNQDLWKNPNYQTGMFHYYQFKNYQSLKRMYSNNISKVFLLSGDTIKKSMENIFAPTFQQTLKEFMNE